MGIVILLLIIGFIIAFIVAYPYIGFPVVAILIIIAIVKRKSIKAWYDNLPEYERQEKKIDNNIEKITETISEVKSSNKHSVYDPASLVLCQT